MKKMFIPPYVEQAVLDLEKQSKALKNHPDHKVLSESFFYVACLLRASVKIMLPDNGEIYRENNGGGRCPDEEEVKSMEGCPAPIVALCYRWTYPISEEEQDSESTYPAPKRITLIVDEKQIFPESINKSPGMVLYSVFYNDQFKIWSISRLSIYLPKEKIFIKGDREEYKKDVGRYPILPEPWKFITATFDLTTGKYISGQDVKNDAFAYNCFSQYLPDMTAMTQCFHSLRANALLDEVTHFSSSKKRKHQKKGVGGFSYYVLRLPPAKNQNISKNGSGSHASPRFHIRRAHIRKLSSGELTFVRQCFVGDKEKGIVNKDYIIGKML